MDRQWYLSRDGQVFGPVNDGQLAQSAAAGRLLATDQLNVAGQTNWISAATVPGLFPAPKPEPLPLSPVPEPVSLAPVSSQSEIVEVEAVEVVEVLDVLEALDTVDAVEVIEVVETVKVPLTRTVRATCFACFREVSLEIAPGAATAHCPRCRASIETGEPPATAPTASANPGAFATLESPAAFKQRMQKKVAEAQAAAARDGAILGAVVRGVTRMS